MSRSRGAVPPSLVRKNCPYRVRIEAELLRGCGFELASGSPKEAAMIDGVAYVIYRFADPAEAERFSRWTIGELMPPDR